MRFICLETGFNNCILFHFISLQRDYSASLTKLKHNSTVLNIKNNNNNRSTHRNSSLQDTNEFFKSKYKINCKQSIFHNQNYAYRKKNNKK